MAFLRSKQGREQLSTRGLDEKDFVMTGMRYNVVFLGSILVPTPTGHGSSRTENAVDKVYQEKYKAFGYGSRKVGLEISVDEIKVIENIGNKVTQTVAKFETTQLTFCNIDMKHDKAFVFIVSDARTESFRAYVFHCDSATRAKELLSKLSEALQVKANQIEAIRLRSYSAPAKNLTKFRSQLEDKKNLEEEATQIEDDWGEFEGSVSKSTSSSNQNELLAENGRQRSQTDLQSYNNLILTGLSKETFDSPGNLLFEDNSRLESSRNYGLKQTVDDEDEFTSLAEKRIRSFDDQAIAGTGEALLLLNQPAINQPAMAQGLVTQNPSNILMHNAAAVQSNKKFENENLLQF